MFFSLVTLSCMTWAYLGEKPYNLVGALQLVVAQQVLGALAVDEPVLQIQQPRLVHDFCCLTKVARLLSTGEVPSRKRQEVSTRQAT